MAVGPRGDMDTHPPLACVEPRRGTKKCRWTGLNGGPACSVVTPLFGALSALFNIVSSIRCKGKCRPFLFSNRSETTRKNKQIQRLHLKIALLQLFETLVNPHTGIKFSKSASFTKSAFAFKPYQKQTTHKISRLQITIALPHLFENTSKSLHVNNIF